jgi:hypothetical protein
MWVQTLVYGTSSDRPRTGQRLCARMVAYRSHRLVDWGWHRAEIVGGTSSGSLLRATYVAGGLGELGNWAVSATWREVAGLINVWLSGSRVVDGKLMGAFLRELGITQAIESYSKR